MSFGRDMARGAAGGIAKLAAAALAVGVVLGLLLYLGLMLLVRASIPAPAQSAEERAAWFRSLKQPDTGMSCCDVSDCRATEAFEQPDGAWFAKLPDGQVVPVPPDKILQHKTSIDGDAYLCSGARGTVYCFIPPPRGM